MNVNAKDACNFGVVGYGARGRDNDEFRDHGDVTPESGGAMAWQACRKVSNERRPAAFWSQHYDIISPQKSLLVGEIAKIFCSASWRN
jgi:hypothetical protein